LIKTIPKILMVDKTPKESFNLNELISGDSVNSGEVKIEKKKLTLSTSDTEDIESAITLLNTLIEKMGKVFVPFISNTEDALIPLLKFYLNEEVRIEACNLLPTILTVIKNSCSTEDLHLKAKKYIMEILSACDTEFDNETLAVYIENMGVLVDVAGVFLNTQELNGFFEKIIIIFENTEKKRLELVNDPKNQNEQKNSKEEAINSDDEDEEEDNSKKDLEEDMEDIEAIQEYIADLIGMLFKSHKELTMEIVKNITTNILPKYFSNTATTFETKMGIFIVDDLIENLGQDILKDIWDDIAKIMIMFNSHNIIEIRRAASFGIGLFAKHTKVNFSKYSSDCLNCLVNGLKVQKKDTDDDDDFEGAKDNATSSLGKIIKSQTDSINVAEVIPIWLNHLPILFDLDEAEEQHLMLCQIMTNNQSNLLVGEHFVNLPKVLKIFAKIFNTKKYSNDEIDNNIKAIVKSILNNSEMKQILINTKNHMSSDKEDQKIKKKLESFIAGDFQ